jgi:3(or 17)beta-hydroxysteroid dehydrogenase
LAGGLTAAQALRFDASVVMITGASSGIGLRAAESFADDGATVIACDVAAPARQRAGINYRSHDVTDESAWEIALRDTLQRYGRLDALVNCAGVVLMGKVETLELAAFRRIMAINVEGTFLGMKHAMRAMLPRGSGSIVNLSSIAGINGSPGASAYCASKGAVRLMTNAVALEAIAAGGRIRVNSIHPHGHSLDRPGHRATGRGSGDSRAIEDHVAGRTSGYRRSLRRRTDVLDFGTGYFLQRFGTGDRQRIYRSMNDGIDQLAVLVTGASSGIGAHTVMRLEEAGARVVACDINPPRTPSANFFQLDVTDEADWIAAVAHTVKRHGRVDALVNCAGIIVMGNVEDTALADFRRVMAVNVEGTFLGMKHVMRAMLPKGYGAIVNLSSTAGIAGARGASAYCASKGAVRLMTKAVALEAIAAGSRIRVNSLHPALTATPMVDSIVLQLGGDADLRQKLESTLPGGRLASTDDIVDAIMFLISDRSKFMNGAEMVVDNGFTAQ